MVAAAVALGCTGDKPIPEKGHVDDSPPPGTPIGGPGAGGKADADERVVAIDVQSPHPYDNDMYETYRVDLNQLPHCAFRARLHFAALRTEASYDHVHLESDVDGRFQSLDGTHDDTWTDWASLVQQDKGLDIILDTDYSVTRHGFAVDAVEFQGSPICPTIVYPPCPEGTVDVNAPLGVCDCPQAPTCVAVEDIEVAHAVGGGFTGEVLGKRLVGTTAMHTRQMPGQDEERTQVGTVAPGAVLELATDLAASGVLHREDVIEPQTWNETFTVRAGGQEVHYVLPQGQYPADVAALVDRFEGLFTCGTSLDPLTCGSDHACEDGTCVEDDGCVCTQQYDPVCGEDGQTYSNACMAGCANAPVRHDGECGITGDTCGGFAGTPCQPGYKCRYDQSTFGAPFPDAAGQCVEDTYCDAAPDCEGLPHIAVPGSWACEQNQCAWQQSNGSWQQVEGWHFETEHPYGNEASTWKKLYLPQGAGKMRLAMTGVFELEDGYDELEVWTWNGSWQKVATYTGDTGPSVSDEFPGRYHYLHFVSDPSVTKHGFNLIAEYSVE